MADLHLIDMPGRVAGMHALRGSARFAHLRCMGTNMWLAHHWRKYKMNVMKLSAPNDYCPRLVFSFLFVLSFQPVLTAQNQRCKTNLTPSAPR
jgi:hypothetical protein